MKCNVFRCNTIPDFAELHPGYDGLNYKIKNNPQSLILYVERGKVFGLRGSYRDALKDFQHVLNLEPDNVEVKLEEGIVFLKLGQPKKALALFSEIVNKYPTHQLALMNRARAFRRMGDHHRAALDYDRALNLLFSPKPDDYIEIANHYV